MRKITLISELYQELEKKDFTAESSGSMRVSLQLSSGRIDHYFSPTASVKVIKSYMVHM